MKPGLESLERAFGGSGGWAESGGTRRDLG